MVFNSIFIKLLKKIIKIFSGHGFTKLSFVSAIYNVFCRHAWVHNRTAMVHGNKMIMDLYYYKWLLKEDSIEPLLTNFIIKEVRSGDTVVDIGANIGYFTLLFAKLVGKTGNVYAFEPYPESFKTLKRNVLLNAYKNTSVVQKAVSNTTGETRLFLSNNNTLTHRICDFADNRSSIQVKTIKLDDFFSDKHLNIDFAKIDVEGAEALVLQGMRNILEKNTRIKIIMEFLPTNLMHFGVLPSEFLHILTKSGFTIMDMDEVKMTIEKVDTYELLKKYTPERMNRTNLFCYRG